MAEPNSVFCVLVKLVKMLLSNITNNPNTKIAAKTAAPKISKNRLSGDFCSSLSFNICVLLIVRSQRKAYRHTVLHTHRAAVLDTWLPFWRSLDNPYRFVAAAVANIANYVYIG